MNQIRHVDKPWGFEIWWAHTESYAGKLLQIEAGHRLSLQYHERKDESCYLLSGRVRLIQGATVDDLDQTELAPGACWRNRPGEIHTVEAVERSVLIEASTPELDDVVRLLDDYDRVSEVADGSPNATTTAKAGRRVPERLIDRDQLAAKLDVARGELSRFLADVQFPEPTAYFRGRMLWEETAVEAWLHRPAAVDAGHTARAS
jgi:mannose-6-phosphate isomerase